MNTVRLAKEYKGLHNIEVRVSDEKAKFRSHIVVYALTPFTHEAIRLEVHPRHLIGL